MSQRLEADPDGRGRRDDDEPRGGKFKALLLVIAVAGLGGGSWWVYRSDLPHPAPENVPVIHSDAAPVKTVPTDPGGMVVPDQDSVLLNRQPRDVAGRNQPKVEELLPDPEPVLPRPVAPPKPIAAAPPPPAPSPIQQAPASPPPTLTAPVAVTPPTPPQAVPQVAAAPPPPAAAPAAPAPTVAPSGKGYRLQLGALKTEDAAKQEWLRLQKAQADVLGKLVLGVSKIELGDKGTYYRIQAGPIADATQAAQACTTLKSRNVGCILVKP